ncbi:hypothetical protein AMATHDRAFT_4886 [Amanita thiersii Skay4041]|uniref:Uncharacterized protein n=1 Tax=Amanita thiersii Skay4041 TaxID=703135 RepID=A0A2A9NP36_9AGAR|nr:hypothetical protein AMATHDRAFT_4886 [Amanita thiersii Skay4041]
MTGVFLDNNNRGDRADQLASDVQHLQEQIRQSVSDAKNHDERAVVYLNEVIKARGFKTLDDFIKEAEKKLSEEQREEYHKLKKEVEDLDDDVKLAFTIGSGLYFFGATLKLSATILRMFLQRQLLVIGIRTISMGLLRLLSGDLPAGLKFIRAASKMLSRFFRGGRVVGRAATAFRRLKVFGKALCVAGILIDVVTFAIDFSQEKKQRDGLQAAIKELCIARFEVKKIQMHASVVVTYSSDARATLDYAATMQDLVKQGLLTQEVVDAQVNKKLDQWITSGVEIDGKKLPSMKEELDAITDAKVYETLDKFDKDRSAWLNEDPGLKYIVDELEKKEKQEKAKEEKEEQ